jgi:hypothetical protein
MTGKREYPSGNAHQDRQTEKAEVRKTAKKEEERAVEERVRKSIKDHGA